MHVHKYEKIWLFAGVVMLVVFLATITTAAVVDGFVPPSRVQSIDPAKVSTTPPFDRPGLHRIANNQYEAYCVGHIFAWEPSKLAVPAGAHVTFYVTSTDVVHGFSIPKTGVNTMVSPGWVSSVAYTFAKPGASIVMFVVVAVGTRLRNDLATEPVPFAFATVDARAMPTPAIFDRIGQWSMAALALAVLSYAGPVYDYVSQAHYLAPGMRTW